MKLKRRNTSIFIVICLLCCIQMDMNAQQADSSIFSKPLNLDASVKTERVARSEQKGDTLIFNAAAYRVMENADSERLLSKMPGISISGNGVEANGKEVTRVLLDDQEFFGNDVLTALRNVPADMVKQIEIINRLSDSAQLTGVDDGEGYIAINIVTKRKKGTGFTNGRVYGSYGISDIDDHRHNYIAGGNVTNITDKRTISLIGMSNNISKFNFTSSNIVSGAAGLDAAGGGTFKVKELSGISNVHSLGATYTNKTCNFTYFFNEIKNYNHPLSDKFTMTSTEGKTQHTYSESDYEAHNTTHRISGKISLSPSQKHSLTIRPTISIEDLYNTRSQYGAYQYLFTDIDNKFLRHQVNNSYNDRWSVRVSSTLNYRYKFKKRKRSFGLYGQYSYYKFSALDRSWEYKWTDIDADLGDKEAANKYFQDRNRLSSQHSGTAKLIFTEPLTKRSLLSGEYTLVLSDAEGSNLVYPFLNKEGVYSSTPKERVSAINKSSFYHNRLGVRYNYVYKKISIAASATYQNTIFKGSTQLPSVGTTVRTYHHPLYLLTANIPFNKANTLKIEARGKTRNPSNSQLQNIVDRSSTSNVRAGNPNLAPAYMHEAEMRYINTNKDAGTTFSLSATYTGSSNYFCDSLVINQPDFVVMTDDDGKPIKLGNGNQYTKPINMGGYNRLSIKSVFAMPIDFLRCNFNIGAQASIQTIPGMINEEKVPIDRNWYQLSGRLDSNISKDIDFTISYLARYTENDYSGKFGQVENSFITHKAVAQFRWHFFRDYTLTGAYIYKNNKNTDGRYNDHFHLCDIFIGRKFLKSRQLEVSAGINDLFNNNARIYWHSISASGQADGENIGIGRYFSIQAIWHFRQGKYLEKK